MIEIQRAPDAFAGWPNSWKIGNGTIELVVTGDVGPRILSFGFRGGQNLFKTYPDQVGGYGEEEWRIRGGSRIWIAPEEPATYAPDNVAVGIEVEGNVLTATAPVEPSTLLQKQMIIRMDCCAPRVEVSHRIRNRSALPTEFAIWILTVMACGGIGITGFPPRGTHPENLAPTNPLVMWAFTNLSDPRLRFTRKYCTLRQDPENATPQKLGHFNADTWGAYLLNGELFLKSATAHPGKAYPDFGCSFEIFTNGEMLELETLGPLEPVSPGGWVEHKEQWSLHRGVSLDELSDAGLDRLLDTVLTDPARRERGPFPSASL